MVRYYFLVLLLGAFLTGESQSIKDVHAQYRPLTEGVKQDTLLAKHLLNYSNRLMDFNNDTALPVIQRAVAVSAAIGDTLRLGKSYSLTAIVYSEKGMYDSSDVYFGKAIAIFKLLKHAELLGASYNNLGNQYFYQDRLEEAISHYMESIRYREGAGIAKGVSLSYMGIANCFYKLNQLDKNMFYLEKAEALAKQQGDTSRLISILVNKATNYGKTGKEIACIATYRQAYELADRKNDLKHRYLARLNLADRYITMGRYDSALYYIRIATPLAEEENKPYYLALVHLASARVYDALGQHEQTRKHALRAVEVGESTQDLVTLKKAYGLLTRANAAMRKGTETVEVFSTYEEYSDSLQKQQSMAQVNQLETRFRTQQKDKELSEKKLVIAQQDLQIQRKNVYILSILGALVVLLIVGVFVGFLYRQQRRLQQQRLMTLEKEQELTAVQAMMAGEEKERVRIASNLHDGAGSMLAAVKLYVGSLENQYTQLSASAAYKESLSLLNDVSVEIRETSHNLMPRIIQEQGLAAAVAAYCDKLGKGGQLKVSYQCYGEARRFDPSLELMLYRTIQELLGNVVKHAGASSVLVQLSYGPELFTITVEDNGKGFELSETGHGPGIGIFGLQSRVAAFRGVLDIDPTATGTTVYIEFSREVLDAQLYRQ